MEPQPRDIQLYITATGQTPFTQWLEALRDSKTQTIINKRLDRVRLGNLGDHRSVGSGVWELRIDYGSGYRIYFGQVGSTLVLLLSGGDKSTQTSDILKAKEYWEDYEQRQSTSQ